MTTLRLDFEVKAKPAETHFDRPSIICSQILLAQ